MVTTTHHSGELSIATVGLCTCASIAELGNKLILCVGVDIGSIGQRLASQFTSEVVTILMRAIHQHQHTRPITVTITITITHTHTSTCPLDKLYLAQQVR